MSKIISYTDESAVDMCVRGYNHIEGLVKLCVDNNLLVDYEVTVAGEVSIDDVVAKQLKTQKPLFNYVPVPKVQQVIINSEQNLVDLAIQETGSVEGLIDLLRLNGLAPNDTPVAENILNVMGVQVIDEDVRNYYKARNYKVNTGSDFGVVVDGIITEDGFYILTEDGQNIIPE